jgi:hypothetical protein
VKRSGPQAVGDLPKAGFVLYSSAQSFSEPKNVIFMHIFKEVESLAISLFQINLTFNSINPSSSSSSSSSCFFLTLFLRFFYIVPFRKKKKKIGPFTKKFWLLGEHS